MGKKFLETHEYTFAEFCNKYKKFLVPPFQRAYNWKAKQINELWDSLIGNDKEYFIGNLVCLGSTAESEERIVIIDGQQRLFSIFLMLTVIRDEYELRKEKEKKAMERITNAQNHIDRLLFYQDFKWGTKKSLTLLPGKSNLVQIYKDLLEKKINIDDKKEIESFDDNQIRFIHNYKTIRELIRGYVDRDFLNQMEELIEKITSLLFVAIICNSDNDAFDIFEGLNATGIGLSVADLVKNAVMQSVKGQNAKNSVEENWEQLENIFEDTKISLFPKFLRHQWISENGYISKSELFRRLKQEKLKSRDHEEVINYTKELLDGAKLYTGFLFEKNESYLSKNKKVTKSIVEVIKRFRYLDLEQVYELLLAFFGKFTSTANYTERQFCHDLKCLWSFCLRAKVISINPSEYEKKFADQCKYIKEYKKNEMNRMTATFFNDIFRLVSNDDDFSDNFVNIEYKYESDADFVRFLIESIMQKQDPKIKITEPTIEHILPREPNKWGFKKSDVESFVNKIGNLTLLHDKDNKSLGNEKMSLKVQKVYSISPFKMNRDLADKQDDFEKNVSDAIKKRGHELAIVAKDIWGKTV